MNIVKLAVLFSFLFFMYCLNQSTEIASDDLKVVKITDTHSVVSSLGGDTSAAFELTLTNNGQYPCTEINVYTNIYENNKITEQCFFNFQDISPGDTAYSQALSHKYSSHDKYQKYTLVVDFQTQEHFDL